MSVMELRPHQVEAVDGVLRIRGTPSGGRMPLEGLRTQVIAATGSGKTLIGAESAHRLSAHRVPSSRSAHATRVAAPPMFARTRAVRGRAYNSEE
ncbi:DEAD/DEAH box helicase family protein [Streptomyces sp. NPDC014006]|uniref:DEAD/DEAH box helicase family protein n=1 Tax=Streptomyces sp. NPDC014006 TaxID=3364870 RepID=UPI003700155E